MLVLTYFSLITFIHNLILNFEYSSLPRSLKVGGGLRMPCCLPILSLLLCSW